MTVEKNIKQWVEHQRCEEKVVHDYHDYANEVERVEENAEDQCYTEEHMHTHLSEENFPVKLHYMLNELETDGIDDIVSWQPHGRCFLVHKQQQFVEQVLPLWFRQTKFPSLQRQLNLYGFKRLTTGRDKGAYYHELFLRSKRFLSHRIQRVKIKGKGARKPSSPETEPNFYSAPPLPPTKVHSRSSWTPTVGSTLSSRPYINPGMGGSLSLYQQLAYPTNTASFQNQQAHLPPLLDIIRLQEFQAQAHLQQLCAVNMRMLPMYPAIQTLPNFQQHTIPMVNGRQDGSTAAMTASLSRPNPDPASFTGLPVGFWRGVHG